MKETSIAIKAAKEAGKIILDSFGKAHEIEMKSKHDFATETDVKAEEAILDILKGEFPGYGVLAEESGSSGSKETFWVVDPLDGTTNFSIGNPFFDVTIALVKGKDIVTGVVYAPFTGEMFSAEMGSGAFLNGSKISVSKEQDPAKLLMTYCNSNSEEDIQRICNIFPVIKPIAMDFSRMRAGALELALVAAGRVGAYLSTGGNAWDLAAGSLLIREAGGRVTNFEGREWDLEERDILATNMRVHNKLLEIVKGK